MPGILPMKVIKVGSAAQSRIAQACDRYVTHYRQLRSSRATSYQTRSTTDFSSQMPKQEDSLRRCTTMLFAVRERRIRMQNQRQAQPTSLPQRLHREPGGARPRSGDGSKRAEGAVGREGRKDRRAIADSLTIAAFNHTTLTTEAIGTTRQQRRT